MDFALPHKVGHYTLTQRLGQGGMGVVYRARDERLGRDVALKMIAGLSDDAAIKRFWREARAAAAVSHPNVCQIFEVDESPDGIYLAMELLAGEPLDARLGKSACSPRDAVKIALEMLGALSALHELGFVHRDIKPSNVFLTPHGVKVLDFGLARPISENTVRIEPATITDQITKPGMMIGTPRYMAPEQIRGQIVDQRADIYAVGTVLFEMLAGRAPFMSENVFDLAQAVLNDHPPALQGPASVIAIDRVIRRALAKDAAARFPLAKAMAAELSSIVFESTSTEGVSAVRALLRVVVPPLRLAREDSDAQFLSYGLAEAVSGSLAGLRDLVVRSPALAAKWSATDSDPRQLAHQADVDVVVSGTLQRMGDQLRAQMQAVEAKSGTVLGAASIRGTMTEIFAFEDQLTQGVIGLLTPLRADSGKQDAVRRDVPANGRAFELFLRGIELARDMSRSIEARAVFQEALEHDPAFAPAWAWLARCHRVIGKYMEDYEGNDRRADEAFRRALALSPDLPVVHRFYTHYESERGRSDAAVSRLLQQAKSHRNDAQLFAALTHACRYSGLMGASTAAHDEARRLDPTVPTSVEFTYLLLQRMDRLAELGVPNVEAALAYDALFNSDVERARKSLETLDLSRLPFGYRVLIDLLLARNENPVAANNALDQLMASGTASDPEAIFLGGVTAVSVGLGDRGVSFLRESVMRGFTPVRALSTIPVLAPFQQHPGLLEALDTARKRQRIALAVFERGGGPELLGIAPEAAL